MRPLIFILAVLAVAVILTQMAIQDPGYVLITRKPWSVETSLTFFSALLALAFVLCYLLARLLIRAWWMPAEISAWRQQRLVNQAQRSQAQGIIHLVQREWAEAERHLLAHLDNCKTPLISYLGAAIAAQHRGDLEKRDKYLSLAHESAPKETLAIGLTQAELQHESAQAERALATLNRLQSTAPKNTHILRLLVKVYRGLRDWRGLAALLATLRKRKLFSAEELDALEIETYRELLSSPTATETGGAGKAIWYQAVPRHLRTHPTLVAAYAQRQLALQEMEECEVVLRAAIAHKWDPQLVHLYGLVKTKDVAAQLKNAEAWLKVHPYSPNLLLTAGRLAIHNKIWGNARTYLEASISNGGPSEAYFELGQLLEQLGEKDGALAHYRKGLQLTAQGNAPAGAPNPPSPAALTG